MAGSAIAYTLLAQANGIACTTAFTSELLGRMNKSNTNRRNRWERTRVDELGYSGQGRCMVSVDPRHLGPTEVETLPGVSSKAEVKLGWAPTTKFTEMVREDFKAAELNELIKHDGFKTMDYHE